MLVSPTASSALNLAHRPFRNQQPVIRLAVLLWVGAVVLLAVNVLTLWRHATGSSAGREDLAAIRAQIDAEVETSKRLHEQLATFDLEEQNEQAEFLNHKIAERAFPWSRLFDQIGEVLPRGVRLTSLKPTVRDPDRRRSRDRIAAARLAGQEVVDLEIRAEARSADDILELLDVLYRHPAFHGPNLRNESQDASGLVSFNLSVAYLPEPGEAAGEVVPTASEESVAPVTALGPERSAATDAAADDAVAADDRGSGR